MFERTGMRKDRYSSLAYNYYVAVQIENKINKRQVNNAGIENSFIIKPPVTCKGKVVSNDVSRTLKRFSGWY